VGHTETAVSAAYLSYGMASLKVLLGLHGANRVWHLPGRASGGGSTTSTAQIGQLGAGRTAMGRCGVGKETGGVVVFFVGDQLEGGVPPEVLAAQVALRPSADLRGCGNENWA